MKLSCNVIIDFLPLYVDGACSEESHALVEEHISECDKCRFTLDMMSKELPMPKENSLDYEDKKAQYAFKKIRQHWKRVIAVLISLCLILILGSREISGGIAISNISGIISSHKMLEALINRSYEKAFSYIDTDELLYSIKSTTPDKIDTTDISHWSPADWAGFTYKDYTKDEFRSELKTNFITNMEALNKRGIYITSASFNFVGGSFISGWRIFYSIKASNERANESLDISLEFSYHNGNLTMMTMMGEDKSSSLFTETEDAMFDLYNFD